MLDNFNVKTVSAFKGPCKEYTGPVYDDHLKFFLWSSLSD